MRQYMGYPHLKRNFIEASMKFLPVITQVERSSTISELMKLKFRLDRVKFRKAVEEEANRDSALIEKFVGKNNLKGAEKIRKHRDNMLRVASKLF
jgi:hypothetical protein